MKLQNVIEKHGRLPENLIHILLEYQAQKDNNSINEDEISHVARELGLSENRVYSVITFYSLFSKEPRGKYVIQVCNDVPCHVNGSFSIIEELEDVLKIKMGDTTRDGIFTLEKTSCLGCCDKSPAIRVGESIHGDLTPEKISEIISFYRREYDECRE